MTLDQLDMAATLATRRAALLRALADLAPPGRLPGLGDVILTGTVDRYSLATIAELTGGSRTDLERRVVVTVTTSIFAALDTVERALTDLGVRIPPRNAVEVAT